ncbi:MAG: hypothetical protein KJ597_05035 [Nanoarchaeota archaeon]|nr:hypothetical protein [Nanoarchaeota archaeon]MBU1622910.1 hypothetical protein [Nanoarchaeota archaeon]
MAFGAIEILALILIVLSVVKMLTLLVKPQSWFNFTKKMMIKPKVLSGVSLVLAAVVLYFLVTAGVGIVQILAVMLFMALFILVGLAQYIPAMLKKINPKTAMKEQWFYALLWLALLVWGVVVLFF